MTKPVIWSQIKNYCLAFFYTPEEKEKKKSQIMIQKKITHTHRFGLHKFQKQLIWPLKLSRWPVIRSFEWLKSTHTFFRSSSKNKPSERERHEWFEIYGFFFINIWRHISSEQHGASSWFTIQGERKIKRVQASRIQ